VRTHSRVSLLPIALVVIVAAACGKSSTRSDAVLNADLERDLKLAQSTSLDLASKQSAAAFPLTEVPIKSSAEPSKTVRKAPGPKAVHSTTPTVKAAAEPAPAVEAEPQVDMTAPEPAPSTTTETAAAPDAPAVPRPSPVNPSPAGDGSWGRGGSGSGGGAGGGAVLGGIFGVIIRGGGVDGDRCEIHNGRGRNRPPGGIYPSNPYPMTPSTGGTRRPTGDVITRRRPAL
jgi:hypothetical protein